MFEQHTQIEKTTTFENIRATTELPDEPERESEKFTPLMMSSPMMICDMMMT